MRINKDDLGNVLLSVLAELYLQANGRVGEQTLLRYWPDTGLRGCDLATAINILVEREWLVPDADNAGYFILTESGNAKLISLESPWKLMTGQHQRILRKTKARARRTHGATPAIPTKERRRRAVA